MNGEVKCSLDANRVLPQHTFGAFFLSCTEYQMRELWRFAVHARSVPFSRAWQPAANVMGVSYSAQLTCCLASFTSIKFYHA